MAATCEQPGIETFLKQNEEKDLLRLSTAGSVDDGKSTLIGRLLYDSKGAYEDQIASVRKASVNQAAGVLDFALLTDGLRQEREQGITIDVAYRYFSTPRRKFIIADTPGHEQYTRNMATGASTADLAIILIDARNGVLAQSRRHLFIATLLGIRHIVVTVNKMDLVDFSADVFHKIRDDFAGFAAQLPIGDLSFIPISALGGDNVVTRSQRTPWYEGPCLLEYLETAKVARDRAFEYMRFPVQYVIRPNLDFRGFAGQVASGAIRPGDAVMALPSGRTTRVKSISTYDGDLPQAFPPMSVTLCLEDEVDISRGDMLAPPQHPPQVSRRFEATMVWMNARALDPGRPYLIKHTTQQVGATVAAVRYRLDVNTLDHEPAERLGFNEIGAVTVETKRPLFFDAYEENRATGAFILIDPLSNETVAAGMITGRVAGEAVRTKELPAGAEFGSSRVTPAERFIRAGHRPVALWLSASEEVAYALERKLFDRGCLVQVLLRGDLAALAGASSDAGFISICLSSDAGDAVREAVRHAVGNDRFLAVDHEGLSADPDEAADEICRTLEERGYIRPQPKPFSGGAGI
ncbi:MAG TPA: sulfate adenylyltransferase subunit CysN [Bryobacteraceae bacterium]|nr:sulfate adenylyltransferase subunit CysN [Bryobacteraceae bacterium]